MSRRDDLPSDDEEALGLLTQVAEDLGCAMTEGAGYMGRKARRLSGELEGLPFVADVTPITLLGAASYYVTTRVRLTPALDLGLHLKPAQVGNPSTSRMLHLPKAWRQAEGAASVSQVQSWAPCYVMPILERVPAPTFTFPHDGTRTDGLSFLSDEVAEIGAYQLGRARDVTAQVRDAVGWAGELVRAAQDFEPEDHATMKPAVWRGVAEALGGELAMRLARYRIELPSVSLSLATRWTEGGSYRLHGEMRWPALPFERLALQPQADRSWVRRLFMRDVEIGEADFDEAFIIDAAPEDGLRALVTPRVREAALTLLGMVDGLRIGTEGATFVEPDATLDRAGAERLVKAALELAQAVAASQRQSTGAYR